jgi:hypothetical protein
MHGDKIMNYKLLGSAASGLFLAATVVCLSFSVSSDASSLSVNLLIVILGFAVGWLLGIIIFPYDESEKRTFSEYTKAVGVFISGYAVGKVDKVIDAIFQPDFILSSVN